jgi:hypothetical protein
MIRPSALAVKGERPVARRCPRFRQDRPQPSETIQAMTTIKAILARSGAFNEKKLSANAIRDAFV